MQVVTGTVIDGQVVIPGISLPEGSRVTVVAGGADDSFVLSGVEEDELLASLGEIERGEHMTLEQLLATLPANRTP